jgi:hypothetical protein
MPPRRQFLIKQEPVSCTLSICAPYLRVPIQSSNVLGDSDDSMVSRSQAHPDEVDALNELLDLAVRRIDQLELMISQLPPPRKAKAPIALDETIFADSDDDLTRHHSTEEEKILKVSDLVCA